MLRTTLAVVTLWCMGSSLFGQLDPVATGLKSIDWREREHAYRSLTSKTNRTPEEDAALVALLLKEENPGSVSAAAPPSPDANADKDHEGGGDFEQYLDSLVDTVKSIADEDPERSDVWPGLLAIASYNGDAVMMPWLAKHADKVAPYFLAVAQGANQKYSRAGALIGLAKIMSHELDPATAHHLNPGYLRLLEATIRQALNDPDELVRIQAITALGIMGVRDDLGLLDRIAATDPFYDSEHDYYPYRTNALLAARALRRRLDSNNNSK